MLDNHRFQFATLATQDRSREMRVRNGLIDDSGKRIFRIGRERYEMRPVGRR